MSKSKKRAGRVWPANYIKRRRFSLVMPAWMYEALNDAAADQDIKRGKLINDAVKRALKEHYGADAITEMRGDQ